MTLGVTGYLHPFLIENTTNQAQKVAFHDWREEERPAANLPSSGSSLGAWNSSLLLLRAATLIQTGLSSSAHIDYSPTETHRVQGSRVYAKSSSTQRVRTGTSDKEEGEWGHSEKARNLTLLFITIVGVFVLDKMQKDVKCMGRINGKEKHQHFQVI